MQYLITLLLVVILAGIVFYDLKYLTIPLYLIIPVLVVSGIRSLLLNKAHIIFQMALINLTGTLVVILLSCILLFILKGRVFNPVNTLIGTGDLLFLPVLCISFSPVNYLVFFIGSSLLIIIFRLFIKTSGRLIPLAGMQSIFLALALIISEIITISPFDDQPILNLIL
jgi:Flp pilus assembly protein protease CpaA